MPNYSFPADLHCTLLRTCDSVLFLPHQVRVVRVPYLYTLHRQILREVRPGRTAPLKGKDWLLEQALEMDCLCVCCAGSMRTEPLIQ